MFSQLGTIFSTANLGEYAYLSGIVTFLDGIVIPATVTLLAAAAIMIIVIAVALAKADSPDKAEEMKKRLIGLMVTVLVVIFLIWTLGYVLSNFSTIMNTFRSIFNFS